MSKTRENVAHFFMVPQLDRAEAKAVRADIAEDGKLTQYYVLMCGLSAGIATLGLLQSSTAVVIGAMLISPLMGPIAAMGFAFAAFDAKAIRDNAKVILVGALVGIAVGMLMTWFSPIDDATPEILARTQPSLLDLVVALLSGIAGGYATVFKRSGTVVGVAIATALMPPLAVVGYGLATAQFNYAGGAFLLFITNLVAIAFAFALIARLSGVQRPKNPVKMTSGRIAAFVFSFLALAIPLSVSLIQITQETRQRSKANDIITQSMSRSLNPEQRRELEVAQLEVVWPFARPPEVKAIVATPIYLSDEQLVVQERLNEVTNRKVSLQIQQLVFSDSNGQESAMVDAAMSRTIAGINADTPPINTLRGKVGVPTTAMWINRFERVISFQAADAPGWSLANYRAAEKDAGGLVEDWKVRLHPAPKPTLTVSLGEGGSGDADTISDAIWALQRWGVNEVTASMADGAAGDGLVSKFKKAGIKVNRRKLDQQDQQGVAQVQVIGPPPK